MQQIMGKVNPLLYAENGKELLKEYKTIDEIPVDKVKPKSITHHQLVYDSATEQMEPVYFFILKLMNDFGMNPKKYQDNFSASPGSGHFSEMGGKKSQMQQQGTKIVGDIYMVLRGVLQLVYDLRDFKIRLKTYDDSHVKDKDTKEASMLTLKQLWLDKVDIQKGNSSVKAMALGQAGFQTLLDGFLVVQDESLKDLNGNQIDLNDRVKRILKGRIREFNIWLSHSESELRKRYKIQVNYLKSQVNTLKLYTRWARPYLKAAEELEMREQGRNPDLIKSFNSILLELSLIGKNKINIHDAVYDENMPAGSERLQKKGVFKRDYFGVVLIDFYFRGIPQKFSQRGDYTFGGRTEVHFTSYALNEDELKKLDEFMEDEDLTEGLRLIQDITEDSLKQIQEDIDEFLKDAENGPKEEEKKTFEGENPFLALIGHYNKKEKPKDKKSKEKVKIRKESWLEKEHLRRLARDEAIDKAFLIFDVYKKAHGMASWVET